MYQFLVIHTHDEGITTYRVESTIHLFKRWHGEEEQLTKLAEKLEINYEPHRDEKLEIVEIPEDLPIYLNNNEVEEIHNA